MLKSEFWLVLDIHAVMGFLTAPLLSQNVWTLFAENNLSHQALVAVLHHFVHVGQQKRASAQQRVFGVHSAGLYLLLLEIPGEPQDVPLPAWGQHRMGRMGFVAIPGGPSVGLMSLKCSGAEWCEC